MLNETTTQYYLYVIITIIISLTVHEFMHSYVGYLLGDDTARSEGRLSLNPLNHIDPWMTIALPIFTLLVFKVPFLAAKPVPFDLRNVKYGEYGAALIALAGPVSNLLLAIIGVLIVKNINLNVNIANFLVEFTRLNVWIFIFNLIPIPPLDGSRVLYAFAPEPVQEFMRSIERFGFFIIIALVLVGGTEGILDRIYNNVLSFIIKL